MIRKNLLVLAALLLTNWVLAFGQAPKPTSPRATIPILRNGDILRMHMDGVKADEIIAKIVTSYCNFDIFPPVLRDFRMRGVPDAVLSAMIRVPHGPPASAMVENSDPALTKIARLQIPAGTVIEVEPAYHISSENVEKGSVIAFLVTGRVLLDQVLVIAPGAVAHGRIINSRRAGVWGRAGRLDWELEDVVAVDGTRVPIQLSDKAKGTTRTSAVVAAALATGVIIFPYTSPVALVWWLRRGDDAVLHRSENFTAVVSNSTEVAGLLPDEKKVIYHLAGSVNLAPPDGGGLPAFNTSFRATSIRQK